MTEKNDTKILEKHQEDTAVVAIRDIADRLAENMRTYPFRFDVTKEEINEAMDKLQDDCIEALTKNKVVTKDVNMIFDSIQSIVNALRAKVALQIETINEEILARTLKSTNPTNDKFDFDFADIGSLFLELSKKREETGGLESYLNVEHGEMQEVQEKES